MQHEPCGLLGDSERPRNLTGANAVLCAGNDPHCRKPLLKRKRRILKDGAHLGGKLPLGVGALALPLLLVRKPANIVPATSWAGHPIRPTLCHHVGDAIVRIGVVDDRFLESGRGFHAPRIGHLS